ncbi:MAG: alpha-2,8-polysialyltransferase family protein [Lachnospiraceae bacterium]|nr:alpha-2,8-polysialyltransferase family protein [Lachnospiraceae bacterium]
MKVALFCWRPYHVFNAINIVSNDVEHSKGNTTLFLFDYPVLVKMVEALTKSRLFEEVIVVKNNRESGDHAKKLLGQFKSKFSNYLTIEGERRNFSNCFNTIMASSFNIDLIEMIDINKKARICIYEDGVNSYSSDANFNHLNPKFRLLRKVLLKDLNKIKVDTKYFYSPEILSYTSKSECCALPVIKERTFEIEKSIFNYNSQKMLKLYGNKSIIFLDQRFQSDCYEKIEKLLRKRSERVILRPHPNDPPSFDTFSLDDSEQSWELICNDNISNSSVIISVNSMALFTPYILYHKKPTIIALYKLILNEKIYGIKNFDLFCQKFKQRSKYENMFIPETLDEFGQILTNFDNIQ